MKALSTHYIWDISGSATDTAVYAVTHRYGAHPTLEQRDRLVAKARRICVARTGNRKAMRLTNEASRPYDGRASPAGHGEIIAVPSGTRPLPKWRGKSAKPIAVCEWGDEHDWYDFKRALDRRVAPLATVGGGIVAHRYWRIDGCNLDWLGRDGSKVVQADTATELLQTIYHEDIVRLYCGKRRGSFVLNAPTHDTPTGSFYTFTPISERSYRRAEDC
jgi:hypothetical protein